jgi:hypothetical protein
VVGVDLGIRGAADSSYIGEGTVNGDATNQTLSVSATPGQVLTFYARVTNSGNADDKFKVKGPSSGSGWTIKYFDDQTNADITSALTGGSWSTPLLSPGNRYIVRFTISPSSTLAVGSLRSVTLTGISNKDSTKKDNVKVIVTVAANTASVQSTSGDWLTTAPDPAVENPGESTFVGATRIKNQIVLGFGAVGINLIKSDAVNVLNYTVTSGGAAVEPESARLDDSTGDVVLTVPATAAADERVLWHDLQTITGETISGSAAVAVG